MFVLETITSRINAQPATEVAALVAEQFPTSFWVKAAGKFLSASPSKVSKSKR